MKKIVVFLLTVTMIASLLCGCGRLFGAENTEPTKPEAQESVPKQTKPKETKPTETEPTETVAEDLIGHEDTYWVMDSILYHDGEAEESGQLDPELWFIDFLVRVNGTARFRDVRENVCLVDDSYETLWWEGTEDGHFLFYNGLSSAPVLDVVCQDGMLAVEYVGMTVIMKQAPVPDTVGNDCIMAELAGTWLLVSGETEGGEWPAMPGELSSMVFSVTYLDGPLVLIADMEERDHLGSLFDYDYQLETEYIPLPLYDSCENGAWCVRVGPLATSYENGCPSEPEIYVTLLDYNTLLMQRYYTFDGQPAVSYQTYVRFPDLISWQTPEYMELDHTNWTCAEYTDYSGEALPMPSEMEGLQISLDANQICYIQYGDGQTAEGVWQLEHGGVMLLRSQEDAEQLFWFGGAASGFRIETDSGEMEAYQMSLYYNGGIIKLVMDSYG